MNYNSFMYDSEVLDLQDKIDEMTNRARTTHGQVVVCMGPDPVERPESTPKFVPTKKASSYYKQLCKELYHI